MRHKLIGTGIGATVAALAATVGLAQPTGQTGASNKAPEAQPPSKQEQRRGKVVASFEGGTITVGDVEEVIEQRGAYMRGRYQNVENRRSLFEEMLRFELLAQEAERRGFGDRDIVQEATKRAAVQVLTKNEFDDKLSLDSVPKEEVKKYYEENIRQFVRPETRHANHILLPTKEEAEALMEQAQEGDLREFRRLAQAHSKDESSALRGGDLRYFDNKGVQVGQNEPSVDLALVKAVFALNEVGDLVSKPIKVDGGWSIVKLTGKRPAVSRSLQDAGPTIRRRLWHSRRAQALDNFIAELKGKYNPELHPELVKDIELEVEPAGMGLRPGFPTRRPPGPGKAPP